MFVHFKIIRDDLRRPVHQAGVARGPCWVAWSSVLALTIVLILTIVVNGAMGLAGATRAMARIGPNAEPCLAVVRLAGGVRDAGPSLQECLDATTANGTVALPAGRYLIATPLRLKQPVTLMTRGISPTAPPCSANERRCVLLHLAVAPSAVGGAMMPFDIDANNVRLDHLVFQGALRTDPDISAKRCAVEKDRPIAGGLGVRGDALVINRSVFRDMACYTAFEYRGGTLAVFTDNDFVGNGLHEGPLHWADGLTIHHGKRLRISGNRFRDNTDVQLILGECIGCTIKDNRFSHSEAASGGSFADIMLQAWPKVTSGDFTDTQVVRNIIDCGSQRRCGFGIMIGSAPWYDAPAFGGSVTDNQVRGAMLALNVDGLTGPMVIKDNIFVASPGMYPSNCGLHRVTKAVNVSPKSRGFVTIMPSTAISYRGCILNHAIEH